MTHVLFIMLAVFFGHVFGVSINEFQPNPIGTDPDTMQIEFVGTPFSTFRGELLSFEGDAGSLQGTLDRQDLIDGTFDSNGLLTVTIDDLENPSFALFLLSGESGLTLGTDYDVDNDGTFDAAAASALSAAGVEDALYVSDITADDVLVSYVVPFGGVGIFTNSEPVLVFRDGADRDVWYAVSDTGVVRLADGTVVDETTFDIDPTVPTFDNVNPTVTECDVGFEAAGSTCTACGLVATEEACSVPETAAPFLFGFAAADGSLLCLELSAVPEASAIVQVLAMHGNVGVALALASAESAIVGVALTVSSTDYNPTTGQLTTLDMAAGDLGVFLDTPTAGVCLFTLVVDGTVRRKRATPIAGSGAPVIVAASGSVGDPHIYGAFGARFDFVGVPNGVYNMISTPMIQVNAKMGLQTTEELFVTKASVVVGNDVLTFDCFERPDKHYELMGQRVAQYGATVEVVEKDVIHVSLCDVLIRIEQRWVRREGIDYYYLDIGAEIQGCEEESTGVIGETYRCVYEKQPFEWIPTKEHEATFIVEGLGSTVFPFKGMVECKEGGMMLKGGAFHTLD